MSWVWGPSAAVRMVVTVVGSNGAPLSSYYPDLAVGDKRTITVPEGATAVTLTRPARERVEPADRRAIAHRAVVAPTRPTWLDDSDGWMWVRWWLARRRGHRVARHLRQQRHGGAPP